MQNNKRSLEQQFFSWLVTGVGIALVIVTGLVVYTLQLARQQYIADAQESATTIADLLQSNLHASVRDIDLALRKAEAEFRNLHAQQRFETEAFSAYLRDLKERIPDAASIRGADANGMVVYGEGIDPAKIVRLTANATGKEVFEHAQADRNVVFGLPVKSRITGQWVLPVARALSFADGRFGGVVYANINIDQIASMFSALGAGTQGEITLFDALRRVLHQSGSAPGTPVDLFALDPASESMLMGGQNLAAYLSTAGADGRHYITKLNAIAPYPVYLAVRLGVDGVLVQWWQRAQTAVLSLLLLYAMAGLMLWAVKRAMHRQQLAQNQVERQTRLLDEVVNQLPFGVVAYDGQWVMRLRNGKYGELMRYPPEFLQREGLNFYDVVHYAHARGDYGTEAVDALLRRLVGLLEQRKPILVERRQADGSYVEIRAMPIFSDWTLLTFTDISTHKASEQTLQAARDAADAANRVKSDFLATMSHEIRTPMNGVLGMLKLLQHTELSRRQLDYTKKAEGATRALLGIINDILDFSKVEAGKLELHHEPMVLAELMRELSVILSASVASKEVEVLFALGADVPPVLLCDGLRLRQVLLNLLGNAIKFTSQGEVVLGIVVVQRSGDQVVLEFSVRDTGIGIPTDKVDHIFEAFQQAETSTTRRFGGTGLGLAISRQLVALMGGSLELTSALGQGSRFFFRLPFTEVPAAVPLPQVPAGRGLRVLVVDDNALARDILQGMTAAMGWVVDALDSGEAALRHLGAADAPAYDLVLVDWRMPGMDGWVTTRQIRQIRRNGKPPVVIMVTAVGRELLAEKAKQETDLLDGYLVKPITASMLYEAVADAMTDRSGERHAQMPQQAGQRLQGMRLLVVEDNLLNQQIAQELLQRNGAQVQIAACGLDGVAQGLAAQPPYDAILMDLQMPDIDGLEATRRLRSHAAMQTVPIIAMTANAMQSDKQACLDAGMVDHVSKPFDLEVLINTILRHVHVRPDPPVPLGEQTPEHPEDTAIDLQAAVARLGGSREFYDKVVASFRVEAAQQLAGLQGHMAASDYHRAVHCAHTLKGLAATIGAMRLSACAARAEDALGPWQQAGATGQPTATEQTALAGLVQRLAQELAQTLVALDHA